MTATLDYRLVLDGFADAVIASDAGDRVVYVNAAAEALLGWSSDELLGQPLTTIMPPRLHATHTAAFRRFIATHEPHIIGKRIRVPALHRSGAEIDIELTLSAFQVPAGDLVVASLRDLSARTELERQLVAQRRILVQYQVMRELAEAATADVVFDGVLRAIGEVLDWDVGVFWSGRERPGVLVPTATWGIAALHAEAFIEASRELTFAPGEGLPGQVWTSRQPVWSETVGEDPRYVRAAVALEQGFETALLFPVIGASEPFGVLEFLTRRVETLDDALVQTMATLGFQVGQTLERLEQAGRLRASQEWLATTMRSIGDAVIATDERGHVELINPVAQALTGWTAEEAAGRHLDEVFQIVHEVTREPLESPVARVLRERCVVSLANHTVLLARDGTESIIEDSGAPIVTSDGAFRGVVMCFRDTTDKVLSRRRVAQAERRAALVAESVPNIIWTSHPDGEPDFFNRCWYDYTGLEPGSIEPDAWRHFVHPDDLAAREKAWQRSLETGEPCSIELRLLRATDQAYRWHLVQAVPLVDDDGQRVQWVGSATDIDAQKRAQESTRFLGEASAALATSLDYPETLKRVARLAVPRLADWCVVHLADDDDAVARQLVVTHRDPDKVRWAQTLSERYPPDPAAPHGAPHVIRTGQAELLTDIPDSMLESAAVDAEHLRLLREVGLRSAMTLPLVARHRILGAITLVTAESGRRYDQADLAFARELATRAASAVDNARLYQQAQDAVRVRDEFLSLASHELKTPLTPLQLHIQALQRSTRGQGRALSEDKVAARLDTLHRQVDRLEMLIDSMLDISRITTHNLHLEHETFDLAALVGEIVERYAHLLEQAGSELDVELPESLVGCWDRLRLDQVISNLLSNAIKFGAGQPIGLALRRVDGGVELVARDRGIGIVEDDQTRIFGRFERAVSTRQFGGFGLGLWITRQIVEALGGSIRVDSQPGHGSVFTVELPLDSRQTTEPDA